MAKATEQPEQADPQCQALYIHVPFCRAKCRYCDFFSVCMEGGRAEQFVQAANSEVRRHQDCLTSPLRSVFLGGGTPTVLGPELLGKLLEPVAPLTDSDTEFSVEANPGTIDADLAGALVSWGVNRVSLGVQSLQDSELALLGRIHDRQQAMQAVAVLRSAGVKNLGLDLIYGIPGQTLDSWRGSLRQALDLGPDHLSCYALSFEAGTLLWQDLQYRRVAPMDDGLQRECYDLAIDLASAAGLEHYEISNFARQPILGEDGGQARPGRRCRHNLTYWHNEPYLGIGPGAASYVGGVRRTSLPDLDAYVLALSAGQAAPCTSERLTGRALMAETVMLELRLTEGLDRAAFSERFGQDILKAFPSATKRYLDMGMLVATAGFLRLSRQALFVADTILADILAEA